MESYPIHAIQSLLQRILSYTQNLKGSWRSCPSAQHRCSTHSVCAWAVRPRCSAHLVGRVRALLQRLLRPRTRLFLLGAARGDRCVGLAHTHRGNGNRRVRLLGKAAKQRRAKRRGHLQRQFCLAQLLYSPEDQRVATHGHRGIIGRLGSPAVTHADSPGT